ncbi:MAG: isoprenylcysteine carboxylmethyltransferase family protein [Dehalococcoidia bacterium]|nr:MAG: isoprenylcysteine carboxylmethyltransferase family protein [Dehalococcoidia bacterium]
MVFLEAVTGYAVAWLLSFVAWEAIVALVLLNADIWFRDPFSVQQIVSWILLIVCIVMAIHGFYILKAIGKPSGDFEHTTTLVKRSDYKYIRHPLYSSLSFMAWGAFLKDVLISSIVLVVIVTVSLVLTARMQERENISRFGKSYSDYIKETRMSIPFLF